MSRTHSHQNLTEEGLLDMAYATLDDLLLVEPTIQDYGVIDWDAELARSETEVKRVLKVRWWQGYARARDIVTDIDFDKLDDTQWTQATVYHAMAYHISPKLTQFSPERDKFREMMDYYQGRFEHEMDLCIREGVRYDADGDSTYEYKTEVQGRDTTRLRR
jgi:hypothetical protein